MNPTEHTNQRPGLRRGPLGRKAVLAMLVVLAGVVIAGAVTLALRGDHSRQRTTTDAGPAAQGARAAEGLVSRDVAVVRASVTGLLASSISVAALAPPQTSLRVEPGSWKESGDDAILAATVTSSGQPPTRIWVHLTREDGQWRVLFTEPA
jgi:hypothetical protein